MAERQLLKNILIAIVFLFSFLLNQNLKAQTESNAQKTSKPKFRVDEYIVKMKTPIQIGSTQSQKINDIAEALKKGSLLMAKLGSSVKIIHEMPDTAMMHIHIKSSSKINFLKTHPDVEFVEPNYLLSTGPSIVGAFATPPQKDDSYSQSYSSVQVTQSWAIAKPYNNSTPKTIVAVVDTGLDITHGVFQDSNGLWINLAEKNGKDGVDDDGNGYIDDINGWNFFAQNSNIMDDNEHGTHVSGIILGLGEDIMANPVRESRIQIMPLKFLDLNGSGSTSDAINAITYAVNNGAKVINNSWGGSSYSRSLHEVYTYAYNHNVVIVSAAGNSSQNVDTSPMYPAVLDTPSNIAVASTTDADVLSSFSNFSLQGLVHVAAPGSSILSTVPGSCTYPGCYKYMSGTSMATPFVSGLAAMVIREAPQLSAYQVKGLILGAVDSKQSLYNKVQTSGRVNALKSIQSAINNTSTAYWSPTYSPAYKVDARTIASDSSGSGGGGCGMIQTLGVSSGGGLASGFGVTDFFNIISLLFMMFVPVVISFKLRSKKPAYKRQYSRFDLAKEMQIKIGDEVVHLVSNSISLGGFSFSKNLSIDKGQKIKVKIDEKSEEVDAEVVWNRENNSYGVKFSTITDAIKKEIESWTQDLVPSY